jgi:hypothetical protein
MCVPYPEDYIWEKCEPRSTKAPLKATSPPIVRSGGTRTRPRSTNGLPDDTEKIEEDVFGA